MPRLGAGWLAVVLLAFVAFLYYRPLQTYAETRAELRQRTAEVEALRAERRALGRRAAAGASEATLERAARRLGLVRPGERLFIVTGLERWRRAKNAPGTR
ncbi:MAG: septum formation initiator family protein [Thermoleophilia bacterium]|nr:septum formation initiator family protein [Thermoleophilia bacterium]